MSDVIIPSSIQNYVVNNADVIGFHNRMKFENGCSLGSDFYANSLSYYCYYPFICLLSIYHILFIHLFIIQLSYFIIHLSHHFIYYPFIIFSLLSIYHVLFIIHLFTYNLFVLSCYWLSIYHILLSIYHILLSIYHIVLLSIHLLSIHLTYFIYYPFNISFY